MNVMRTRLFFASSAAAAIAVGVGGCAQPASMTVAVRDRDSLRPLEGAIVRIDNTSLLNPLKPRGAEGETDQMGEVVLAVAPYNRLLIRVTPRGGIEHVMNADHPASMGDSGWFGPSTDERGGRGRVEVRLRP